MTQTTPHLGDDILNAWIDTVATPQERAAVEDHVATCEICRERLDELQAVKSMLGSMPEVAPPRSFALTPAQANRPTPIRPDVTPSTIVRLMPLVRSLSVAAMLAVIVLGAALVIGPSDDTITSNDAAQMDAEETGSTTQSFQLQEPPMAALERGEVVDQGEAASAHDSTMDSLANEGRGTASVDTGLTALEIATITVGALAIILGVAWMWMSMSIRSRGSR